MRDVICDVNTVHDAQNCDYRPTMCLKKQANFDAPYSFELQESDNLAVFDLE